MCSTLRPRSSSSTRSPFSVSSLAAQPPEIPDPTTIASYSVDCIASSLPLRRFEYALRHACRRARPAGLECELQLHADAVAVALRPSHRFRHGKERSARLLTPDAGL